LDIETFETPTPNVEFLIDDILRDAFDELPYARLSVDQLMGPDD
jgi:hypothetical protein